MSRFLTALLAGSALLAVSGAADALTISGGTAAITNTLTDYNQPLGNLNKFNSNLGTLTSISFTTSYGFNSSITVTATTPSSGSVKTESAAQFYSTDSAITTALNSLVNTTVAIIGSNILNPAVYDVNGNTSIYNISPSGVQVFSSLGNASGTVSSSNNSILSPFVAVGGGTFEVDARTLTGTIITQSGGNATAAQSTLASQSISVLYTYDVPVTGVPEPASMALLGAGLIGAGLLRRRAK